jgi:hypothetical protein
MREYGLTSSIATIGLPGAGVEPARSFRPRGF